LRYPNQDTMKRILFILALASFGCSACSRPNAQMVTGNAASETEVSSTISEEPEALEPAPAPAPLLAPRIPGPDPADRPLNSSGEPMSDLELLNDALAGYLDTAAEEDQPRPPLKALSNLVEAGLLSGLPAPPAGKAFEYDAERRQIILVTK
jgi:hypothetical protein